MLQTQEERVSQEGQKGKEERVSQERQNSQEGQNSRQYYRIERKYVKTVSFDEVVARICRVYMEKRRESGD